MSGSITAWGSSSIDRGFVAALLLAATVGMAIALLPITWMLLLVLAGIILVSTLVYPQLGVLLLVPAVPFGSLRQVNLGAMNVGITEALLALAIAAWLMRGIARREIRVTWPPLALPLALFLGVLCFSSLGSMSLSHSIKEILKWVEVLALYILVSNQMDEGWSRKLVFVCLGTGALVALHGIYQFLFQVGPEGFILFGRFMRAHGTFEQPNPYAGYLGLLLPLAVGLALAWLLPMGQRLKTWWLIWATTCGALMSGALIMSWSRGAWLGFATAASAMALAILARSGRAAVLGTLLALLLLYILVGGGLSLVPPAIAQRFSDFVPYLGVSDVRGVEITDANFAVLERMAHWQSALEMWADRPWLGVGIGNYGPVYPRYALPLWPLPLGHAHNYYLNVGAEAGLLGLLSYLVLWVWALIQSWRATRRATGWQWGVALGVLGMVVHLSAHSLFDNLYVHSMYLQVAMLLGIIAVEKLNRSGSPSIGTLQLGTGGPS